jgi:hypothetical protein
MDGLCGSHGRRLAYACALALLALLALGGGARSHASGHAPFEAEGPELSPMGTASSSVPLTYHGGNVMHSNKVYAIYWVPAGQSVSANYRSVIDGYFQNVAADDGKTTNVYATSNEYTDGGGRAAYNTTWGGSLVDTQAFPASGCTNYNPLTQANFPVCLTDAQITTEIDRVAVAQNWTRDGSAIVFMFTPKNVGTCNGGSCFANAFCAYHSAFWNGHGTFVYANMPYDASTSTCGSGWVAQPNGDDADLTLNVTSHEHMEAITDPFLDAWFDANGNENGDRCAWTFGTPVGGSGLTAYNQVINGGHYYLQQEWSNATNGCVLTGMAVPANTALPSISGTTTVGATLTIANGSWSGTVSSYEYAWQRCTPTCATISGATAQTYQLTAGDGGATIRALVWAVNAVGHGAAWTPLTATVAAGSAPASSTLPVLTGAAGVGQTLTVSNGTWTGSPTSFQYSWSRCPTIATCATISGAYGTSYTLTAADVGTSVKALVWAVNASGHGSAWTTPTGTVAAAGLPANSTLPALSGTAAVGQTLTVSNGSWANGPITTYNYSWSRCNGNVCSTISGEYGATYTLAAADSGMKVKALVWAYNASGHGAAWTVPVTVP